MPTTTTNFGWTVPSDTDLVKDGAAAIRTALGGPDTSFVDLKGGTTGQVLAKASGTDLDFSWVAQDDSNAIQNAIVDAKGDLIAATAADTPARLAVGANGTVLTADSAEATGMKWASAAASGGLTLIATTTLSGTSVTVSSIPGTYKYLKMIVEGAYLGSGSANEMRIRYNSDTGNNYSDGRLSVNNATFNGEASINNSANSLGYSLGVSSAAQQKFWGNFEIQNYTSTSGGVAMRGGSSSYVASTHSSSFMNNAYNNSAAITSITYLAIGGASFGGGTVLLYGVN